MGLRGMKKSNLALMRIPDSHRLLVDDQHFSWNVRNRPEKSCLWISRSVVTHAQQVSLVRAIGSNVGTLLPSCSMARSIPVVLVLTTFVRQILCSSIGTTHGE